jgi:adenylosuccinate synthase
MNNQNITILGLQWGDEGKGKVVDYFSRLADIVVRYGGGANAGHTVVTDSGKFVLHLLPTGILNPKAKCLIGGGVVCDLEQLIKELDELSQKSIDYNDRIFIDFSTHLVLPQHKAWDKHCEGLDCAKAISTTLRGIGPAYADRAERIGLTAGDLLDDTFLRKRIDNFVAKKKAQLDVLSDSNLSNPKWLYDYLKPLAQKLENKIVDVTAELRDAILQKKRILFEGAQGALLDIGLGTYPYVTSSSTTIGGLFSGLGLPPGSQGEVLGIMKAYTTRVGNGPFPTELSDETGERLRQTGGEFGATTGRPRRTGWLDLAIVRRSAFITGTTSIVMTKLDVLDGFEEIKVCTLHKHNGKDYDFPPLNSGFMEKAEPVYETLSGWSEPTSGITEFRKLPAKAKDYIKFIENYLGIPIKYISTGSHTKAFIEIS